MTTAVSGRAPDLGNDYLAHPEARQHHAGLFFSPQAATQAQVYEVRLIATYTSAIQNPNIQPPLIPLVIKLWSFHATVACAGCTSIVLTNFASTTYLTSASSLVISASELGTCADLVAVSFSLLLRKEYCEYWC